MNDNNYLVHHGVKGMKWGIRRYQNKDGTLTAEGKKKYGTVENLKQNYQYEGIKNISLAIGAIGVGALVGGLAASAIKKGKIFGSKVLKKGTALQNMNKGTIEKGKSFFAAYTPEDKKIYREGYNSIMRGVDPRKGPVLQNIATLDEDIKLAGNRQFAKALKKVVPNAGVKLEDGIPTVITSGADKRAIKRLKQYTESAPVQIWQRLSPNKRDEVQNILLKKGFKGAIDANDMVNGVANSPAIIFKDAKLKGLSSKAISENLDGFNDFAAMNRAERIRKKVYTPQIKGRRVLGKLSPFAAVGATYGTIGETVSTSKNKKNGRKR